MPLRAPPGARHAPSAPRFIAYYRVSTDKQGASGLGLEAQKTRVEAHISGAAGVLLAAYTEIESGKRSDRKELKAAVAACRLRHATLVIAKLDRLARNALFLLTLVEGLGAGGVVFCDLPQIPPGPIGKLIISVMAAIAEFEAGIISERTKAALAVVNRAIAEHGSWVSRRSGQPITRLGGPQTISGGSRAGAYRARRARSRQADQRARDLALVIDDIRTVGACRSLHAIAAALTARGIPTAAGATIWTATQVSRAIARAARLMERA